LLFLFGFASVVGIQKLITCILYSVGRDLADVADKSIAEKKTKTEPLAVVSFHSKSDIEELSKSIYFFPVKKRIGIHDQFVLLH